ncbi:MAG: hypothetical protein WEB88_03560 [Gemmatimonadota bacterium]
MAVTALVAACGSGDVRPDDAADSVPEWVVSDSASTTIGKVEGSAPQLLNRVADATELPDGTIAVLNGDDPRVRIFDRSGEYLRGFVSTGQGPGELTRGDGPLLVRDSTLLIADGYNRPMHRLGLFGEYIDQQKLILGGGRYPWTAWYEPGFLIWPHHALGFEPAVREVLGGLAPVDSLSFRQVRVSQTGLIWIGALGRSGTTSAWSVLDATGQVLGRVRLPEGFDLLEMYDSRVLGIWRDVDGVEFVRTYEFAGEIPPHAVRLEAVAHELARAPIRRTATDSVLGRLRQLSRDVIRAQELAYPGNGLRYVSDAADLAIEVPDGFELLIPSADERGFRMILSHGSGSAACFLAIGEQHAYPGVPSGTSMCY